MNTRNSFSIVLLGICVLFATSQAAALLTDPAVPWPADTDWLPYLVGGAPIIDAEGGMGNDSSNGGASFSGNTDIASAYDLAPPLGTCTNGVDSQCGTATSAFYYYDDQGTPADTTDDWLFTRLRVNGNPGGTIGFDNFHWNVLIDISGTANDGYKDVWVDVFGGFNGGEKPDQLRLLSEDNGSNDVTNDDGAGGSSGCGGSSTSGGTFINSYYACAAAGLTDCRDGSGNDLSHTRIIPCNDGSGDYYVDIQVPIADLTDNSGCYSGPTKLGSTEDFVRGTQLFLDEATDTYTLLYSTSNSNTDPLQKDFVDSDFGDPATTPVRLASFDAERSDDGVLFRWTTATETRNIGFYIEQKTPAGWTRVNQTPVFSHNVDSTSAQEYEYFAPGSASTEFRIADIDTKLRRIVNGPFELGRSYGKSAEFRPIDWASVQREHHVQEARRANAAKSLETQKRDRNGVVCRFEVAETGMYKISAQELNLAGYDLSGVKTSAIALTRGGASVPLRIGGRSHRWSSDSSLVFFGSVPQSIYSETTLYQLEINPSKALRMDVDPRVPSGATTPVSYTEHLLVNDDHAYMLFTPGDEPWYDTQFIAYENSPVSKDFFFNVDHLSPGEAMLQLELWGITDWPDGDDHHVRVFLNGEKVADQLFDGFIKLPLKLTLPPGLLHDGQNTLRIESVGDVGVRFDMVDLNSYGVSYPRKFIADTGKLDFQASAREFEVGGLPSDDVSVYRVKSASSVTWSPNVSVESSGHSYQVRFVGNVSRRSNSHYYVLDSSLFMRPRVVPAGATADDLLTVSADYLVVSHPDFISGLAPLVNARRAEGWTPKIVDVQDIYAAYGDGSANPEAIRSYLADAVPQLGVKAVLLVGGDTFDYLNHLGLGSVSFIPTLYTETRFNSKFTPSDALIADIDFDMVPDVAIGRLPVRSSSELETIITKTLEYQNTPMAFTAVFAAGPSEDRSPFTEQAAGLSESLPTYWQTSTAFVDELGLDRARSNLIDAMNNGTSLVSFVGHSGPSRWTFDGLFETSDVEGLTNSGLPSVMDQWGCWNTYFVDPLAETMAHTLLLTPDRGAAAVIGATTMTSVEADAVFAPLQQEAMTRPGTPLGEAILEAKRRLASSHPEMTEIILGSALLGDPALVVAPE